MSEVAARLSFRDPGGAVLLENDRVLRLVYAAGAPGWAAFSQSFVFRDWQRAGRLPKSRILPPGEWPELSRAREQRDEPVTLVLEHERIAFPSYPYEWPAEMLHAAAGLTLDLAEALLPEGLGLIDAVPGNVMFRGPEPVFIDLLSCQPRAAGDPLWRPAAEFERAFLLPLLMNRLGDSHAPGLLLTRRDGVEPEEVYAACSPLRRLHPQVFGLVSLPVWLGRMGQARSPNLYRARTDANPERAAFVLRHLLGRLRRRVHALAPQPRRSPWSDYAASEVYAPEAKQRKLALVTAALEAIRPAWVLDIGSNTGEFSLLSAQRGAGVVAIDRDPAVVGALWREAAARSLNVLPLVVDIARPTPAVGWRNRECAAWQERAAKRFDLVLCLALVHHLCISERVPLAEVVDLLAELTRSHVLVEFIEPGDPSFVALLRGRDQLYGHLTRAAFESACARRFQILETNPLSATRRLYLLRALNRRPTAA